MIATSLQGHTVSIFSEISARAAEHGALNLSQGFPNFEGPAELKQVFANEIKTGWNQYVPSAGLPETREAVSEYYSRFYNMAYDPSNEITITQGATEALSNVISGLFNAGDEVLVFEPFYDAYVPTLKVVGAKPVAVSLPIGEGRELSLAELEAFITPKTRGMIVNFPHNPSGYVPTKSGLAAFADCAKKHNLLVLSDEVYEHITFDGTEHQSIASLEGMRERTVVVSSIGKTFSFTGWKVGWALAPPELSVGIRAAHQLTSFSTIPASQKAAAAALALPDEYFSDLKKMYLEKRDRLITGARACGFDVIMPKGTYFFLADYSKLSDKTDKEFTLELIEKAGVALIPPATFYLNGSDKKQLRFCFSKTGDVLDEAIEKLSTYLK